MLHFQYMKKYLFGAAIILFTAGFLIPLSVFAAPVITELYPEDNATAVSVYTLTVQDNGFYAAFDQNITRGTGDITVKKSSDDVTVATFDVADDTVVAIDGNYIWIEESDLVLDYDTEYYIQIDAGTFIGEDLEEFAGILDETTLSFTTREALPPLAFSFERISVSGDEEEADGESFGRPWVSGDGRYVAFNSVATNLSEDPISSTGIFLRDRETGETLLLDANGEEPTGSADGAVVVFPSNTDDLVLGDENSSPDIFIYDVIEESIERILAPGDVEFNFGAQDVGISSNGRFVVFESDSTNLVGDDTNGTRDVFLYDRNLETFERINVTSDEEEVETFNTSNNTPPSVSDDGRYVVFYWSTASGLTGDVLGGELALYVRDVQGGTTTVLEDNSSNGSISADGRYILFTSTETDLTEDEVSGEGAIFLRDTQEDTTVLIADNNLNLFPSISLDNTFIAYGACDSVEECSLYRYDVEEQTHINITEGADGPGDVTSLFSYGAMISSDGSVIGFLSNAANLVDNDTNGFRDIFLWDELAQDSEEEAPAEEEPVVEEEDSGRNSSHRRSTPTTLDVSVPSTQDSEDEIMSLQIKLIELLTQLIAELKKQGLL
ncbi:MAG: hypothetical protein QG633_17 [Patescibacteria group bacterium]|nr:hypothetical protein [Patescibacteria group bacterium]